MFAIFQLVMSFSASLRVFCQNISEQKKKKNCCNFSVSMFSDWEWRLYCCYQQNSCWFSVVFFFHPICRNASRAPRSVNLKCPTLRWRCSHRGLEPNVGPDVTYCYLSCLNLGFAAWFAPSPVSRSCHLWSIKPYWIWAGSCNPRPCLHDFLV